MPNKDRHQIPPTPVRLPDSLKADLKKSASKNDRSLNGEIVNRLRSTFDDHNPSQLKGARA
ncbi:hypothetical protein RD110_07900 [Rhodoferax koreense]|uniref:Arc-like DNA binding domain-containing protein n=1 Tax=Rhodoferax koreensis TaxID=1842727 RepID=A0A1P8JTN9_9BURK|nr:hypothetical protein RD110_07900 [Rhodoferax koreense]